MAFHLADLRGVPSKDGILDHPESIFPQHLYNKTVMRAGSVGQWRIVVVPLWLPLGDFWSVTILFSVWVPWKESSVGEGMPKRVDTLNEARQRVGPSGAMRCRRYHWISGVTKTNHRICDERGTVLLIVDGKLVPGESYNKTGAQG